jgi:hypothetical protein
VEQRLVLADSSPLIALAAVGQFELLRELFGKVTITASVRDEVMARPGLPGAGEVAQAIADGWISVRPDPRVTDEPAELGTGEASTLALSRTYEGPCLVLMDDRVARTRAREVGVTVTGVGGLLIAARRAGLVGDVRPVLEGLTRSGFRLSDEIMAAIVEATGDV